MRIGFGAATVALALALAACSQEDAPSDKVEAAAGDIVDLAQGAAPTETPKLADGPYAPRDDCTDIKGAPAFRQQLAAAIEAHDVDGLVALAASDIKLDFGDGAGTDQLRALLSAPDSKLWDELETLLTLGCAKNDQGGITLPWYFAQKIPGDPMATMVVTDEQVPLISADTGEPLGRVSWDAVTLLDGWKPDAPFQRVKYGEIDAAYIVTGKLRSVIGYRLIASSRNGKWSITSLITGD